LKSLERSRRARWPTIALLSSALIAGCASIRLDGPAPPSPAGAPAEDVFGEQRLFRMTYDGGGGRLSLRVVLRTAGLSRFQVAVTDIAGRKVWGLDYHPDRATLVDHREKMFCVSGPGLRLTDVHPMELPLEALPRVLDGMLPVAAVEASEDSGHEELVDAAGRRYRVAYEGAELVGWTLLDEDGPAVWWTRQVDGGILSRRGGEQYRWARVVVEPRTQPLRNIVPEGFVEGVCNE
jgi:hypothetical protein